ncbi:unnamed protein product [Anisakis simplex]|uniref:Surfeit locus protein 6 (inferred by orthology to a human protein) n=2 Tax=Anisakis simplex TaxID=6269 RepID=A0A0M3K9G9_ANISI|nr:unnamed protein product [Anisakis simplex]
MLVYGCLESPEIFYELDCSFVCVQKETKKDKRDKFVGKDYGRLLKKVEKRDQRIASIREKNPEKAEKIEENIKWKNAMSRIEGVKVKMELDERKMKLCLYSSTYQDNAQLLKRGMKRKEKIHEQRKHKWDKRLETVADKQSKRQEKRDTNLQARRDVVKKKKLDKARKKGRIIS